MKAVLSLTRLYFSVFQVQRWLRWFSVGLVTLLLIVLGIRWANGDYRNLAKAGFGLFAIATVASLFPALFTGGPLFRYLSAPSSHRLLPNFRARMLWSLGIWFLALFVLPALLATTIVIAEGTRSPVVPVATVFAFISGCFYFTFRLLAPGLRTFFELAGFLLLLQFLADFGEPDQFGDQLVVIAALLMAAVWLGFVVWYLRGGAVSPVVRNWDAFQWNGREFGLSANRGPDDMPRDLALTAVLRGRLPKPLESISLRRKSIHGLMRQGFVLIVFGYLVGALVAHDSVLLRYPIEYIMAMAGGLGVALAVHQMASRARLIWLLCGAERLSLFRQLEKEALKLSAGAIVFLALSLIGIQLSGGSLGLQSGLMLLVMAVGFGLLAIYIGIFRARNAGAIELAGWTFAGIASFAASYGYLNGGRPSLVLLVVAVQITLAGVLRWFAIERWRDVDWLEFRPFRFGHSK